MPFIKEKFKNYNDFGSANIKDIYGEKLSEGISYKATYFASAILKNNNGKFEFDAFENRAQLSSVNKILIDDPSADIHTFFKEEDGAITRTHMMTKNMDTSELLGDDESSEYALQIMESMSYRLKFAFKKPVKAIYSSAEATMGGKKNREVVIEANFKETQLSGIHKGQSVEVELDAFPGQPLEGVVDSFSPATGAKFALLPPENATGNFTKIVQRVPVKITIPDQQELKGRLLPGLSVVATIDKRG